MNVTSTSFKEGEAIPGEFAFCLPDPQTHATFGPNRNPQLSWSDVPEGTRSFMVICHDPDVPTKPDDVNQEGREVPPDLPRTDFFHWVAIDLPSDLRHIAAGSYSDGVVAHGKSETTGPNGGRQGRNDYTGWFGGDEAMAGDYLGYDGPCPPWNDSLVHHYVFTVFALDTSSLDGLAGLFGGLEVRDAMEGHVLAEAVLTGTYTLNPRLMS